MYSFSRTSCHIPKLHTGGLRSGVDLNLGPLGLQSILAQSYTHPITTQDISTVYVVILNVQPGVLDVFKLMCVQFHTHSPFSFHSRQLTHPVWPWWKQEMKSVSLTGTSMLGSHVQTRGHEGMHTRTPHTHTTPHHTHPHTHTLVFVEWCHLQLSLQSKSLDEWVGHMIDPLKAQCSLVLQTEAKHLTYPESKLLSGTSLTQIGDLPPWKDSIAYFATFKSCVYYFVLSCSMCVWLTRICLCRMSLVMFTADMASPQIIELGLQEGDPEVSGEMTSALTVLL